MNPGTGVQKIPLSGLDGSNPLAFMAAVGVLRVLADRSEPGEAIPHLAWQDEGIWRPVLICSETIGGEEGLVQRMMADLATWKDEPVIGLHYPSKTGGAAHDLKPPPGVYRAFLQGLLEGSAPDRMRSLDFAAAFATEVAVDNNGNTKPMALHFTAGQQQFLDMVEQLVNQVDERDIREALFGPWRYDRELPVLQWDCTVFRDYALRADDPSKAKKAGVPGADWLAFRGLPLFPSVPVGRKIATTGCTGEWKTGAFAWPLWTVPLSQAAVASLLTMKLDATDEGAGDSNSPAIRRARGISVVFRCSIRRSDQGGYGSFSPPAVV